ATEDVADQFPNTKFAITDMSVAGFKRKHSNIEGLTYATQQNSYLIGCLAAHVAAAKGKKNISVVGGVKIPPVDTFLAGYKAGAQKCVPGTTVQIGYSQDFIDQAKCKSVAQNQIDAGSQVVFGVAGPALLFNRTVDAAPVLELRGITKQFPGVLANDHIDFDLRRGEVHALLGENGAGKSTLMSILYGLYTADSGQILMNGKPVTIS